MFMGSPTKFIMSIHCEEARRGGEAISCLSGQVRVDRMLLRRAFGPFRNDIIF
jgi:hypothetical protein